MDHGASSNCVGPTGAIHPSITFQHVLGFGWAYITLGVWKETRGMVRNTNMCNMARRPSDTYCQYLHPVGPLVQLVLKSPRATDYLPTYNHYFHLQTSSKITQMLTGSVNPSGDSSLIFLLEDLGLDILSAQVWPWTTRAWTRASSIRSTPCCWPPPTSVTGGWWQIDPWRSSPGTWPPHKYIYIYV